MKEMKKCLVLGANGLIGRVVGKQLEGKCKWFGTYYKREEPGLINIDITSDDSLKEIYDEVKPDCVINCANLAGGTDFCESHPDLAERFHLKANISIGELCEKHDARMVLISTDYIFDGENPPYQEDDEPNPLNAYGRLKLEAEKWLINNVTKHTIVRTTNVFGWDPNTVTPNYMMNLYRAIKDNKQFRAPSFLWGNPTYVGDLASAIIELCSIEMNGVSHVVGSSFINRYEWTIKACRIADWDKSLVVEVNNIPDNVVPRPLKSNLDTRKFRSLCQTKLRNVDDGIKAFLEEMRMAICGS
ncbi:SDR family oxidoreductase [Chloroflexota bacterium]